MKNILFSNQPLWQDGGMAAVRVITGLFLAYHGLEVFDNAKIHEYAQWDSLKTLPMPVLLAYIGKGSELVGGLLLTIGFLTRPACIAVVFTMLFISFRIGNGKFWYEDQYPVLFALLAFVFFVNGAGKYSIDK